MYGQSSSSTNYSPPTYPVQPPAYPTYPVQPTAHYNYAQPPPYQPVQQTIVTGDAFEAGARFNVGAERRIPVCVRTRTHTCNTHTQPPPPGIMPNMAQYAVAQGHNVVVGQRQETILEGTGGAGAVIW